MKQIFTILVTTENTALFESILKAFYIGLNDWDRSKVFAMNDYTAVNYTVACTEEQFISIVNVLNRSIVG